MAEMKQLEGNDDLIDKIIETLEQQNVQDMDLDDAIHDIADHFGSQHANQTDDQEEQETAIGESSQEGSDINNMGMEAQVRTILGFHGVKGGVEIINDIIQEIAGDDADLIPMPEEDEIE